MRVKISYSCDLEEVPKKTADLLCPSIKRIKEAANRLNGLVDELRSEEADLALVVSSLDRTRLLLGSCDNTLEEVYILLSGLVDHYDQQPAIEHLDPVPVEPPNEPD